FGLRERGIPRYIFEENRDMAELEFTHQNPMGSASRARMLSALMQSFPPAELPRAAFLLQRYDPGEYQRLLGAMTPDTLLVTLVAKGLPTDRIEKNYGTRWGSEALTGAAYQRLVEAQVPADWTLPEPNRFHPGAITLLPPEGPLKLAETSLHHLKEDGMPEPLLNRISALKGQAFASAKALLDHVTPLLTPKEQLRWLPVVLKDSLPLPTRLMDSPLGRIWYQPDWRFRQPKADFSLKFYLKDAASSPKAVMLNHLYTAVMAEGLNEYGYPIRLAGLNFALTSNESGLGLALNGYSARMLDLLDFLVPRLRKVAVDEATFATVKERMKRELENQPLAPPHEQSQYYWDLLMMSGEFSNASLLAALAPLSLADVQAYAGELFRRTWMEGVVVGNLDPHRVRDALQRTLQTLGSQPLPASQQVRPAVSPLPVNADQIFSLRLPVTNSLAYVYQQAGTTNPRLRGALLIIGRKLGESFYNDMRTRQQLGYMVWAGMGQREKTLSLAFLIQSGQYPADTLLDRMDDFMGRFVRDFKAMPDAEFETYRRAVNSAKLERSKSLDSVADRLFWIAYEQDEAWDYISRDMAAVNDLTRKEVEEILERQLTGGEKRRLTIRLTGREHAQSPRRGQPVNLPATTQGKPAASLTGSG
ncbi:MAG: insulinase family protein, partial [Deltaproteobacteria bacterium]|nr:insulinase family protein [Deltaproteobacteria bacterium]